MTKLYSIDVRLYGTAYVRARSAREAKRIARAHLHMETIELTGELVSDQLFDNPDLPDLSLASVATCYGPDRDETASEV